MSPMTGQVALVTGATSGIGRAVATDLARRGATVIVVGRDPYKARDAQAAIRLQTGNDTVVAESADLASQAAIRAMAGRVRARFPRLSLLVNNAGGFSMDRRLTVDQIESTLAVNHLAPYLLTRLLTDALVAAAPARVVTVASEMHRIARIDLDDLQAGRRYDGVRAYALTKALNILFTIDLARRLRGTGVVANAVHPGGVDTGIWRAVRGWRRWPILAMRPFLASPERGAEGPLMLSVDPAYAGVTGRYFNRRRESRPAAAARDPDTAARLWEISETLAPLTSPGGGPGDDASDAALADLAALSKRPRPMRSTTPGR